MNNPFQSSNLHVSNYGYYKQERYPWNSLVDTIVNPPIVVKGYVEDYISKEETETMSKFEGKKHYTIGGKGGQYETRAEAETAAKKYMESYARAYGTTSDVVIYEAVATVKFPLPSYEVVDLAKA